MPVTIGRFGEALFCGFHHFPMSLLTLRGELSMSLPGGRVLRTQHGRSGWRVSPSAITRA